MIMGSSLKKPKSQAARSKRGSSANVASAKGSSRKAGHKARPTLRELAKEFAKERAAAGDRVLTPLQRRMMSGGA
jgi:hypothetical protein